MNREKQLAISAFANANETLAAYARNVDVEQLTAVYVLAVIFLALKQLNHAIGVVANWPPDDASIYMYAELSVDSIVHNAIHRLRSL